MSRSDLSGLRIQRRDDEFINQEHRLLALRPYLSFNLIWALDLRHPFRQPTNLPFFGNVKCFQNVSKILLRIFWLFASGVLNVDKRVSNGSRTCLELVSNPS